MANNQKKTGLILTKNANTTVLFGEAREQAAGTQALFAPELAMKGGSL